MDPEHVRALTQHTAHGHTGHVKPELREQHFLTLCNGHISCVNWMRTFGLCPSTFGLCPVCESAFSFSFKTDNRSAHQLELWYWNLVEAFLVPSWSMKTYCLTISRLPKPQLLSLLPAAQGGALEGGREEEAGLLLLECKVQPNSLKSSSFPVLYFILKPGVVTVFLSTILSHQRRCACQIVHWRGSSFGWCSSEAIVSSKHSADTTPSNQIWEPVPKDLQVVKSDCFCIPV